MIRTLVTAVLYCMTGIVLAAVPGVPRHTIEARLSPDSGELHLVDDVQLTGRDHFTFRLAPWLYLARVTIDNAAAAAARDGQHYRLALPDRGQHVLRFEMQGTVPPRGTAGALSNSGGDGAYLPGFAAWLPLDDRERMRYRLTVSVPAGHRAVATGKLTEEQTRADGYRATFVVERAAEPPSLFTGPYVIREKVAQDIRLRTYLHAELVDLADGYLQSAGAYIER